MRQRQIALCDREEAYTLRFAECAAFRKDPLFSVHGFTSMAAFLEYVGKQSVDISIVAAEFAGQLEGVSGCGQVFLLWEDDYQQGEFDYLLISKFQSCPEILRQVIDLYAQSVQVGVGSFLRSRQMKWIGVYSPIDRSGKTSFALRLGRELGKKRRILYLNLEAYSGFDTLYPSQGKHSLSDLLYFLKQERPAFACKLESMVERLGDLYYIPPVKSLTELRSITLEDWERLLTLLEREGNFEGVILDLSGAVNGIYELLEYCDRIYTPVSEEKRAAAKLCQYEAELRLLGKEIIWEKTCRLSLSAEAELENAVREETERWEECEGELGGASKGGTEPCREKT